MNKTYSACAIANYFIKRNLESDIPDEELSAMKLQKMVYLAHGAWLASRDKPLINEAIEAWRYGPVIRSLYDATKGKGLAMLTDLITDESGKSYEVDDKEVMEFLEKVRQSTLQLTAMQMSDWSHEAEGPWNKVYNEPQGNTGYATISNELLKSYFKKEAGIDNGLRQKFH